MSELDHFLHGELGSAERVHFFHSAFKINYELVVMVEPGSRDYGSKVKSNPRFCIRALGVRGHPFPFQLTLFPYVRSLNGLFKMALVYHV